MTYYQLTYLISPDLPEEKLKNFSKKISDFVLTEGGTLDKTTEPIRKKLAYPIKERKEMFLASLNFYLNPDGVKNLEKKLKSENQILRYMPLTKKISKKIIPEKIRRKPLKISEKGISSSKEIRVKTENKKVELEEIDKKIDEILKNKHPAP
jgi:small subunit ribosomal protein S6